MLIKNTNPNELLAEFERDKNFCPYNEEELERLKKEAERLRKDVTLSVGIWRGETYFSYDLLRIFDNEVCYGYGEYGSIRRISSTHSLEQTECVRFEDFGKIVFFFRFANSDRSVDWSTEVTRTGDQNKKVWLQIGKEIKFRKVEY